MKNKFLIATLLIFISACTKQTGRQPIARYFPTDAAQPYCNSYCWECQIFLTVYGRGTVRFDTICGQAEPQIRLFEQSMYVFNDSVERRVNCRIVPTVPVNLPYPNQ